MANYVPDIKTQRWIVLASGRIQRPNETKKTAVVNENKPVNPFASGSEYLTPPEVYRIGDGEPNAPGWKVRVVPNKFPITDIHEVIIHSPDPVKDIEELGIDQVQLILESYKARFNVHRNDGQVLIFANHGILAGPSLSHPHSQLVVIPRQINLDALAREPVNNVVLENKYFTVYCPDFSQWPYEVWIAPKRENTYFGDIQEEEIKDLAEILQTTIKRLHGCYNNPETVKIRAHADFAYNYYIYHGLNWFVRIIPRFIHRAGFELGTGLSVNIIDPKEAARQLTSELVR